MAKKPQPRTSTLILFVRHGRTPTTGKVLPGRAKGLHLSEEGVMQADSVAKRIASSFEVAAVYTSPVERARETAAAISRELGTKAKVEKGIIEIDNGDWTGLELSKAAKLPEWKHVQTNPGTFRFPGGESFLEMQSRVDHAMTEIARAHPGETVVMVSHADPIKVAVATALQAPLVSIQHIGVEPCSVTAIEVDGGTRNVLAVNNTDEFGGIKRP